MEAFRPVSLSFMKLLGTELCSSDSYVEVLTPNVIVFGDGAFKEVHACMEARLLQSCLTLLQPNGL